MTGHVAPQSRAEANGEVLWPVPRRARERWSYMGRHVVDGMDCYLWKRYVPDAVNGHRSQGYAHPVASFWPPKGVAEFVHMARAAGVDPAPWQVQLVASLLADRGTGGINDGEPQVVTLSGREYERYLCGALNEPVAAK